VPLRFEPGYYEWVERRPKIDRAIESIQLYREALGPGIDIAVDFHAKTSPSVASIMVKEAEPLNLLSEKPGLGFELSEASLAKYPFGGTRPMACVSRRWFGRGMVTFAAALTAVLLFTTDPPSTEIRSGQIEAMIYLPGPVNGFFNRWAQSGGNGPVWPYF
jgi:hypothetical protein